MKISCQSCQSKYTIADDKVTGKVVKIRCKKCGATIVVNGSDSPAAATASRVPEVPATEADGWMVNVAEGDQRTMTEQEIVAAFHAGVVTEETFCWRDGMDDWLPLRDIQTLNEACSATHAMEAPPLAMFAQPSGTNGRNEPAAAAAATPAARRAGGRAGGGDLFGGAAQAGGEDEVMTSAPVGPPQPRHTAPVDDKMTGERNENSVLFSLSALTSKGTGPTKPTTPGVEASGLIDIRQLSAQLHSADDKKSSRIDDIMNLAGGGAFSPSLSGPILSAPAVAEYTAPEEAAPAAAAAAQSKGRGVVILAAIAGVVVVVGAIGTAVMMMGSKPDADKGKGASSTTEVASAAPSASAAAATATASAAASAAPAPTETATAATPPPADTGNAAPKVATNAPKETAPAPAKEKPAAAPAPANNSLAAAMAGGAAPAPAPAPAAGGGGSDQPFNMGEAKARLAAAAAAAQGCKKGDASGTGRVVVLFAPSGAAQSATISGPPFEGTPTGACVAARFRGVHVPAFSGSPFSVSKSFTIN
jgi:predicted Zn finger-like uncharacterized protein